MNTLTPFRYSGTPLRTQLPVVSNREFVRAWMARRAAAVKAAAGAKTKISAVTPRPAR